VNAISMSSAALAAVCAVALCGCGSSTRASEDSTTSSGAPVSESVHYLPGGLVAIAHGSAPGGTFEVLAERYRFQGRVYFNLAAKLTERGGAASGSNFTPRGSAPLAWSLHEGCTRRSVRYAIVYGLLREPRDTAYAYAGARRYALRRAPIPRSFHTQGVAVYAALPHPPTRIVVNSPSGASVMREQLEAPGDERCRPGSSIIRLERARG
jgi:hypothetical protein